MRMLGAPPIPANQSSQLRKTTGPYHAKNKTELTGFSNSPTRQKLFENNDKAESRKKDHELQKKFVKLMKEDMFGNQPGKDVDSRFATEKAYRGSFMKQTQLIQTKRQGE